MERNTLIVNNILNTFQNYRMAPTPIDQYEQTGKNILENKITSFVEKQKPIDFVMLGYPMKSVNDRDKVLGKMPDLAEQLSIQNFSHFNNQVKQVYEPGVNVHIVNDGYVFNDLLGASDSTVAQYQEITTGMATDTQAPMHFYNLNDFYKGELKSAREKLMLQFGISAQELERRIMFDADVNFLYRGMIRFMEQELAIKTFPSRNQQNKAAKELTRDMMLRNEAYSNYVKENFASHIRLSMHPSVNNGAKYSFQLIPGNQKYSPWHCAIVNKNGVYETIHKKDAIAAGYQIVNQNGQPYNFQA